MTTTYSVHTGHILPTSVVDQPSRLPPLHRVLGSAFEHPTTGALCKPSSDCGGSSSGLGGMTKTDIVSSDDSSLASDAPVGAKTNWPMAHPVLLNGGVPSVFMPCSQAPTSSASPTSMFAEPGRNSVLPPAVHRAPGTLVGNNDLFVHVQNGETLSILVGNDVQHITGPATVRMVNLAGMSPSALPLHVPPGHMVQQIVDEQGILRHLILSPESTPTSRLIAGAAPPPPTVNPNTPVRGSGATTPLKHFPHGSASPPVVPPYPPPSIADCNEEVARKNWVSHGKKASPQVNATSHLIHVPYSSDDHEQSQSGASANEEEEWERLSEMLSRMQPPNVLRVGANEADISWQELDTSEASAPGGPFPQIDASEFTYEIVLFESVQNGRIANSYRCEPDSGNRVRLCRLRPNTDYFVHLRASLEERGLQGNPSPAVKFRTLCAVPDSPQPPRFISRTHNSLTVGWRPAADNGSPITLYRVEIAPDGAAEECDDKYEIAYEGLGEQTKIKGLSAATGYRVRVTASNGEGDSQASAAILMHTASPHPPKPPQRPQLVSLSSRAVNLSWTALPEHSYSLEMSESGRPNEFSSVCEKALQSSANITDLSCNRQYHFRLVAHNEAGDSDPSEALVIRTPRLPASLPASPPATPTRPHVISKNNDSRGLEIGWKPTRSNSSESLGFVLEGSADEQSWNVLYKGSATSALVKDANLSAFRVSAFKSQTQSGWSEVLRVRREEPQPPLKAPGRCAAPTVTETSKGCLRVQWKAPEDSSSAQLVYQLHRVNLQPSSIIYQGEATMFDVVNCAPGEEMEVQVRAVALGTDDAQAEGEWSRVAVGRTAAQPPPPPLSASIDANSVLHWNPPATTNGAPITEYLIERTLISSPSEWSSSSEEEGASEAATAEWSSRRKSGDARSLFVGEGRPGGKYQLSVCAISAGGTSVPSECVYVSIPCRVPAAPTAFHVLSQGCGQLRASWRAPCCNGSPISEYILNVHDESSNDQICEQRIPSDQSSFVIDDLEAGRPYKLSICAVNEVGAGSVAVCSGSTLAPPPPPPQLLLSEAGSTFLKLKWKPAESASPSSFLYYYLEKENDNGKFSPIYEGDNRCAKVRNLVESTTYRFRIRCSSRVSGAGAWSSPFEFTTEQLPPPAIRAAPSVTEIAAGSFQVEWPPLRSISPSRNESIFYRLQCAPRSSVNNGTWKTIYEGVSTCYSLFSMDSVQLRVQCVRVREGIESVSLPSGIQFATPTLPSPQRSKTARRDSTPAVSASHNMSNMQWIQYYILSDTYYAMVILALFAALAFVVALLLEAFVFERS